MSPANASAKSQLIGEESDAAHGIDYLLIDTPSEEAFLSQRNHTLNQLLNMKDFYPTVLGSASAGLIARVICHPIDTVKSRLQAGQSAFRSLEGVSALYRGLGAVVVGGVPGVCIYLTSYEVFLTVV